MLTESRRTAQTGIPFGIICMRKIAAFPGEVPATPNQPAGWQRRENATLLFSPSRGRKAHQPPSTVHPPTLCVLRVLCGKARRTSASTWRRREGTNLHGIIWIRIYNKTNGRDKRRGIICLQNRHQSGTALSHLESYAYGKSAIFPRGNSPKSKMP